MAETALQPSPTFHEKVMRRIGTLSGLPTTVGVAVRLFQLERGEGADPAQYARVIASDAGLAGRILVVANSPYYGHAMRISQPLVAVNMLGIAAIRTLAVNFCLSGLHHELHLNPAIAHKLWKASLCKAVAAREIARRLDPALAEDAYLAGLFQDIAIPVMLSVAEEAGVALFDRRMNNAARLQAEHQLLGADHAVFGGRLAVQLKLPGVQAALVALHHNLQALQDAAPASLAHAAYAASLFPHRLDYWDPTDAETLKQFLASDAGGNCDFEELLNLVSAECKKEFSYFDKSQVTDVRLLQLISQATREVADAAVRLVETVHDMKQQVASAGETVERISRERRVLAERAVRDPLTGALNRAGFESASEDCLAAARQMGQPIGMIFIDVDRFKQLNDRHGHAAGDEALRLIVAVAKECTRSTDIIGRLGGDEFAVMLPNCPETKALEIAARIRERVFTRKTTEGVVLSVSLGVTWMRGGEAPVLAGMMAASDQRMYRAKRSGGNMVQAG